MSETKQKPIYIIENKKTKEQRLVRAKDPRGALRHVANDTLDARRPTQDELLTAATAGVKVEEAVES